MINAIRAFAHLQEKIGKPRLRTMLIVLTAVVFLPLFASCVEPSPFYGTWADNRGNTFSFFNDEKFSARVVSYGMSQNFNGTYSVLLNTLTLTCTNVELRVVTEWDIRGNIMYFDWISAEDRSMSMTLFKVSN